MTKRILIADDSCFLREQLRLLIERHPGWKVCEAVDGAEAVRKSQQLAPDAMVLDLRMPDIDGLAAGRQLRQMMPKLPMALFSVNYNPAGVVQPAKVTVSWYDRRSATTACNVVSDPGWNYERYVVQSPDKGVTWEANFPISTGIIN
jgi:two-component system chemotaxis response regulator CheY